MFYLDRQFKKTGKNLMGRSQVVRQRVLIPSFGGSNLSVPEITLGKFVDIDRNHYLV